MSISQKELNRKTKQLKEFNDAKRISLEKIQFIKENFPKYGRKYCANALDISIHTVAKYSRKLGIKFEGEKFDMGHQKCKKCEKILPFEDFAVSYKMKTGYRLKCKKCTSIENKEKINNSSEDERKVMCLRSILYGIKDRCKEKNWPCDLDLNFLLSITPKYCPILGFKLKFWEENNNQGRWDSPSVDRIDNNKPYLKSNVIIISRRANSIKNCSTTEELRKIANFYTNLEIIKENIDYYQI